MPPEPVHYLLSPDPRAVLGVYGSFGIAGVFAIYHSVRLVLRVPWARRFFRKGIDAALDENGEKKDNNDQKEPEVNAAILEFVRRMENDRQADREERQRQWERIEELVKLAEQHAHAAWAIVTTIQNFGQYMDLTHQHQNQNLQQLDDKVIRLSDWLRENHGRPPAPWAGYPPVQPKSQASG